MVAPHWLRGGHAAGGWASVADPLRVPADAGGRGGPPALPTLGGCLLVAAAYTLVRRRHRAWARPSTELLQALEVVRAARHPGPAGADQQVEPGPRDGGGPQAETPADAV